MSNLLLSERIVELYDEAGEPRALFKCLDFRGQRVTSVSLVCSDWVECDIQDSVFEDCDLRGANFADSNLKNVVFKGCAMYGCELPDDPTIETIDCSFRL